MASLVLFFRKPGVTGGNLTKRTSKKIKATPAASDSSKSNEVEENLGQNVEIQEALSQ
jgi:hypothetical protein